MKHFIITFLLILLLTGNSHAQEVKVLTLGTFHFAFPNLDIAKIENKNQIDVLAPEYQAEIEEIVGMLAKFRPTAIAIEVSPEYQSRTDSLYLQYLAGNYQLRRDEHEQIGFRVARQFQLKKLYCTNDWGELPESAKEVLNGKDSIARQQFMDYFYRNPDSTLFYHREYIFKTKGILEELKECNREEHVKKDLGNYLVGVYKYQTELNEFFGVDFTTGWWFNRNLRIFRNIQKIPTKPGDRILVIYGAGHMNILNILFDASPEFDLVKAIDYLK